MSAYKDKNFKLLRNIPHHMKKRADSSEIKKWLRKKYKFFRVFQVVWVILLHVYLLVSWLTETEEHRLLILILFTTIFLTVLFVRRQITQAEARVEEYVEHIRDRY